MDADIFCFNAESVQELFIINDLAKAKNKKANIAIRINPNVDAQTHHFITTGLEENKFGINTWQLPDVADALRACHNLQFLGIHFHIGSQITDLEVYRSLCIRVNEIQDWFTDRGFDVKLLNTGGGLGVDYHNPDTNNICDFESYFKVFKDFLNVKHGQEVHFELGRALVATKKRRADLEGALCRKRPEKEFSCFRCRHDRNRSVRCFYQAYHQIENLSQRLEVRDQRLEGSEKSEGLEKDQSHISNLTSPIPKYDVVGPICESTDCFRKDVEMPQSYRGDLIAIRTTGAYGEVMASQYNLRDIAGSVYSE